MPLFSLEHSRIAYWFDLGIFGAASAGLAALLLFLGPHEKLLELGTCAGLGLAIWTLIEYGLHRFVLHGLRPFSNWHRQHHERPAARIYSPTLVSVTLIAALVYLPSWLIFGPWPACALTFGIVAGDLGYAITHHAVHHWRAEGRWARGRKRWHGRHHARRHDALGRPGYYGVTTSLWDHVWRTAPASAECTGGAARGGSRSGVQATGKSGSRGPSRDGDRKRQRFARAEPTHRASASDVE